MTPDLARLRALLDDPASIGCYVLHDHDEGIAENNVPLRALLDALDEARARNAELEKDNYEIAIEAMEMREVPFSHAATETALAETREERDEARRQADALREIGVARRTEVEAERNRAYHERNALLLVFASTGGRVWIGSDGGEWPIVYMHLGRFGQISFHIHPSELPDFLRCPFVLQDDTPWDGHTTPEKWHRLLSFVEERMPGMGKLENYRALLAPANALLDSSTTPERT